MCELLGLAFNEPVTAGISFRGFRHRGGRNPDGWGLAWFSNSQAEIRKEPAAASKSETARLLQTDKASSSIFIGHVRLASCGNLSLKNTHPFQRTFRAVHVVFAHNGTLRDLPKPSQLEPSPKPSEPFRVCLGR
jgi:glutamine amidotransferase